MSMEYIELALEAKGYKYYNTPLSDADQCISTSSKTPSGRSVPIIITQKRDIINIKVSNVAFGEFSHDLSAQNKVNYFNHNNILGTAVIEDKYVYIQHKVRKYDKYSDTEFCIHCIRIIDRLLELSDELYIDLL